MLRLGLVCRNYRLDAVRVKPKRELSLKLGVTDDEARIEIAGLRAKRALKQLALLEVLVEWKRSVPWPVARKTAQCSRLQLDALVKRGIIITESVAVRREPDLHEDITWREPLTLTADQKYVLDSLKLSLCRQASAGDRSPRIFLLHGITASGKTEVYLQALAEVVKRGRRGIVLVPEISLTPQAIERFSARFPGRVAVQHSRLSLGERFDAWQRIRDGGVDVVVGPRSAIFAPQPDLGLIIIDEEHEWSYKEQDRQPRYHARDVAIRLAGLTKATVLLGSATPDVVTYARAQRGYYRLLELPRRLSPYDGSPLPVVRVVDSRQELKSGNRSLLSGPLREAMAGALLKGEQVILFLNRRGTATFIQCRNCGLVLRCRRCQVSLIYHSAENNLLCHHCNYRILVPRLCPRCHSSQIKFLGSGIQRLEKEVAAVFPEARLLRWDSDTTRRRHAHEAIMAAFRTHQADVLIGTQMVATGLDIALVTLVGVVASDSGLNLPDFRAGERTFQLLSQVAGRAGRGSGGGQVIMQTYSPEHYVIQAAASHDYQAFYTREIGYRKKLGNPPFSHLVCLTFRHRSDAVCRRETERMRQVIIRERESLGIGGLSLIGPAPARVMRLRGYFRWQLTVRSAARPSFLSRIPLSRGWTVDVDPVGFS
jgi:primosomal protein N' (replication factor Y)